MRKRNAFTLIELLAIIIILAIIAVITVPIILNVIDNAKKGSIKDSAYGYKNAVLQFYTSKIMDEPNLKMNNRYIISNNGELSDGINTYQINFTGSTPTGGYLDYLNNNLGNGCITIDDYKVIISNGNLVSVEKGICELPKSKCIRALERHTEECVRSSGGCHTTGHYEGGSKNSTTVYYGNLGVSGGPLVSGDALDCDLDGDKVYDERFYFVSDLYNTQTQSFDSNYAALVYYSDVVYINGSIIPDNSNSSIIIYDSTSIDNPVNNNGPVTAINNLPTINDWSNVSLLNISRSILNEDGGNYTNNNLYELPTSFRYERNINGIAVPLAARLLTIQEIERGCGSVGTGNSNEILNCDYLFENTKYVDNSRVTWGYWLENPSSLTAGTAYLVRGDFLNVNDSLITRDGRYGVRPVIEVLKYDISLD